MPNARQESTSIVFRTATLADLATLAELRATFTYEDLETLPPQRQDYAAAFRATVGEGIASGRWVVWLADADGDIVAHVFVGLIEKIPRPTREHRFIGYVTNVYTRPGHRGRGIGAELLARVVEWATAHDVELLVVWPSEESVSFYERVGFASGRDPLVWTSP